MINITITDPRSITKGVKTSVANQVKEFSQDLLSSLQTETPYRGGRARSGWLKKTSSPFNVKLSNTVPYIERLDQNYSKQTRGRGILKPAIASTVARQQRRNTK
jgi:hypothetical protein